jgi:hypothetical protein
MNKISGIETDSLQGISIYHDELHEGVLSIQVDHKSKPDFLYELHKIQLY